MKRPYVICHILSALNGRISGPFMGTAAALPAAGAYGSLRAELESDAWLYGTTTTKEFTGFQKPDLMEGAEASGARPAAEEDFAPRSCHPGRVLPGVCRCRDPYSRTGSGSFWHTRRYLPASPHRKAADMHRKRRSNPWCGKPFRQ